MKDSKVLFLILMNLVCFGLNITWGEWYNYSIAALNLFAAYFLSKKLFE